MKSVYQFINDKTEKRKKLFCVLIDPDKFDEKVIFEANKYKVDLFFVGGSEVKKSDFDQVIRFIKKNSGIPLVIFPGSTEQVSAKADALLFLSLLSGRDAEFLIGKQTAAALKIKKSKIETIPTGYILINGGKKSSTEKVTGSASISAKNEQLVVSTALAGEMLGKKIIYLEAGSGAKYPIPLSLIRKVKKQVSVSLAVGGGIDSAKKAERILKAGADLIVVGNAIENNLLLIKEISSLSILI
ncbi:MAG: geranylgeranylglyceryl/heptaprenylglyceryl phosphate synthase [Bacteroidia bacterium]|nr:geranylgeranylglyceryl/heptaprenylglyceryl phosphate synthase [Bacteroidia bacterium]